MNYIKMFLAYHFDRKRLCLTHGYAHLLADMHLAVFAPAFTFSLCESESSRKPQDAHSLGR